MGSPRQPRECAYCGATVGLTRDHVIPEALFVSPLPSNMITVPACSHCNRSTKGPDDDWLRDYLTAAAITRGHPVADALGPKATRSAARNQSAFHRETLPTRRIGDLTTPLGYVFRGVPLVTVDERRLLALLERIVRGLYFYFCRARLSPDYRVECGRHELDSMPYVLDLFKGLGRTGGSTVSNVFSCIYHQVPQEPRVTVWLLQFYERVHFSAATIPPEGFPEA